MIDKTDQKIRDLLKSAVSRLKPPKSVRRQLILSARRQALILGLPFIR